MLDWGNVLLRVCCLTCSQLCVVEGDKAKVERFSSVSLDGAMVLWEFKVLHAHKPRFLCWWKKFVLFRQKWHIKSVSMTSPVVVQIRHIWSTHIWASERLFPVKQSEEYVYSNAITPCNVCVFIDLSNLSVLFLFLFFPQPWNAIIRPDHATLRHAKGLSVILLFFFFPAAVLRTSVSFKSNNWFLFQNKYTFIIRISVFSNSIFLQWILLEHTLDFFKYILVFRKFFWHIK